ncbi:MAG: UDP-2,3-diacylglucosamine diphosphatase [Chromatiaceae bacterium]|nr:UDP-2,3-diacylglucosamine diphosphatase [Gammaproteobacteria bacterium]MCP5301084.1 UDP-2,3-diacylglucosamine diphosphatase [Chromatiaceae bacterium]MCP5421444.1 UDP-2,3-diacylglucosamine diphosphatase [Chromatiaceae bacterium]
MARQWFISDVHLTLDCAETLDLFERFVADHPAADDRLFILGDLFDAWIGDDDDSELAQRVRAALARASARGVEILMQHGNRDFLMGRRLMRDCGARLLPDCHVTAVAGEPTLLMHGDLLCTDDVDYQRMRRRYRNPLVQWLLLRKPLAERRRIAADLRRRSGEAKTMKADAIMDVNPDTVVRYLRRYRVHRLIHGHTHRPAVHRHPLPDGTDAVRIVLPEWHATGTVAWVDDGSGLCEQAVV